jgi:hypothetical protein
MSEYEQQAKQFLKDTNTTFKAEFVKHDIHFDCDKVKRDIYKVTFERGKRSFKLMFGQSINASGKYRYFNHVANDFKQLKKDSGFNSLTQAQCSINKDFAEPSPYDVLACLIKCDPGSFKDFCADFGYNEDSRKAENIYKAVCGEYGNVCSLWSEAELEQLQEIN